ncbi:hypothetical protein [Moraxella lacunata]|uniref:hypothetical protein n=1 Tax=Moraxella lacunata TaxID=477 RepID=UPI003EE2BDB5
MICTLPSLTTSSFTVISPACRIFLASLRDNSVALLKNLSNRMIFSIQNNT